MSSIIPTFPDDQLWLASLKPGDLVSRHLAGTLAMDLTVTRVSPDLIHCGDWTFSRLNGAEIDEDLGWDANHTGSYIRRQGN